MNNSLIYNNMLVLSFTEATFEDSYTQQGGVKFAVGFNAELCPSNWPFSFYN
jgi:hypothetical protein